MSVLSFEACAAGSRSFFVCVHIPLADDGVLSIKGGKGI